MSPSNKFPARTSIISRFSKNESATAGKGFTPVNSSLKMQQTVINIRYS